MVIKKQIPSLSPLPGVYLFKDKTGKVIYIGKAKSLKKRVRSYFKPKSFDLKVLAIMQEYDSLDFIITHSETEALLLEAEMIQRYQPKFNTLFKDGQPFLYILFTVETTKSLPGIKLVRNKKQKGTYFGPFLKKMSARKVFYFLEKTFSLKLCNKKIEQGCLDYHIGNCPGNCRLGFDINDYAFRLRLAKLVLKSKHKKYLKLLQEQINDYNRQHAYERSKKLHDYITNLDYIFQTIRAHFSLEKFATEIFATTTPTPTIAADYELAQHELQQLTGINSPITTIDCFDISHFQSSSIVGSCVRFTNGKPDKNKFRRFKIKTLQEQNDYAALQEIVSRRYRNPDDMPDLIVIDGGKGQWNGIKQLLPQANCVSLAKNPDRLFSPTYPQGIELNVATPAGKLLIALRDYAHHFAISYHRLRSKKEIPPRSS